MKKITAHATPGQRPLMNATEAAPPDAFYPDPIERGALLQAERACLDPQHCVFDGIRFEFPSSEIYQVFLLYSIDEAFAHYMAEPSAKPDRLRDELLRLADKINTSSDQAEEKS